MGDSVFLIRFPRRSSTASRGNQHRDVVSPEVRLKAKYCGFAPAALGGSQHGVRLKAKYCGFAPAALGGSQHGVRLKAKYCGFAPAAFWWEPDGQREGMIGTAKQAKL